MPSAEAEGSSPARGVGLGRGQPRRPLGDTGGTPWQGIWSRTASLGGPPAHQSHPPPCTSQASIATGTHARARAHPHGARRRDRSGGDDSAVSAWRARSSARTRGSNARDGRWYWGVIDGYSPAFGKVRLPERPRPQVARGRARGAVAPDGGGGAAAGRRAGGRGRGASAVGASSIRRSSASSPSRPARTPSTSRRSPARARRARREAARGGRGRARAAPRSRARAGRSCATRSGPGRRRRRRRRRERRRRGRRRRTGRRARVVGARAPRLRAVQARRRRARPPAARDDDDDDDCDGGGGGDSNDDDDDDSSASSTRCQAASRCRDRATRARASRCAA